MVGQRTQEIGIRLAPGAGRPRVLKMVMGQGLGLVGAGLVIGILGAAAVSRTLAGLLFGVAAFDPASFAAAPAVLALVALLACYLPAPRAARIDAGITLRYE